MTYCVGMHLNRGLVFMSDTRTNAGVDNVSKARKMFTWSVPGERFICLMTAGNLATTQSVISLLEERTKSPDERDPSILREPSMFEVARRVGSTLQEVIASNSSGDQQSDTSFSATMILGGQIAGSEPRLFLVYPEGNFVEASEETPFFQIGETKYGKPILVRAYDEHMSFEDAVKLLLVSFDSTVKANLTVGLPFDLQTYETDSLQPGRATRIGEDNPGFRAISDGWGDALKLAFDSLPDFEF
ncbi:MAG: proteasome-type protease [Pseudomonadota bacterium]